MTRFNTDLIRHYYEEHTRTFVAFGQGGPFGAMHRAVVGPGVQSQAEAFHYVDDALGAVASQFLTASATPRVIDLGCGIGGSLCYLAERLPIIGTGITLSPTQATIARQRVAAAGLAGRVTIVEGDYAATNDRVGPADLVFAIESFVHAPDPGRFFAQCRRLVRPGGVLAICDDFRRPGLSVDAQASIEQFCRGWHVNTLLERDELRTLAARAQFDHESTIDLSSYLQIGRVRDRLVDLVAVPLERLPWRWSRLDPWLGGSALQRCLRNGWIGYDLALFRRSPSDQ